MISFTVIEGEGGGMCTCVRVSMEPEEGVGAPVTRVTVACEKHPTVGTGNRTQIPLNIVSISLASIRNPPVK